MLEAIAALTALALGGAVWMSPLGRRMHKGHLLGATALVAWSLGAGVKIYEDSRTDGASPLVSEARRVGALAWQNGDSAAPAANRPSSTGGATASAAVTNAAPVHSLIGGLEAKLEANPEDAKGWALLAQSYAFMGESAEAERAMQHAVALGMDEAALRERIARATRDAPKGNWIEQAIGG